jgi:hypothetical protein
MSVCIDIKFIVFCIEGIRILIIAIVEVLKWCLIVIVGDWRVVVVVNGRVLAIEVWVVEIETFH